MGEPARPPGRGRLLLILFGIAVGIVSAWLLLRVPSGPSTAVKIEYPDPGTAAAQPISYYLARADAARGERYFARCAACHTINEGGPHGVGPNLRGVMGNPIASRPGFTYSPALGERGGRWDVAAMNGVLRNPRDFAPGTRMAFAGATNPQDRADVMLYMSMRGDMTIRGGPLVRPAGVR